MLAFVSFSNYAMLCNCCMFSRCIRNSMSPCDNLGAHCKATACHLLPVRRLRYHSRPYNILYYFNLTIPKKCMYKRLRPSFVQISSSTELTKVLIFLVQCLTRMYPELKAWLRERIASHTDCLPQAVEMDLLLEHCLQIV